MALRSLDSEKFKKQATSVDSSDDDVDDAAIDRDTIDGDVDDGPSPTEAKTKATASEEKKEASKATKRKKAAFKRKDVEMDFSDLSAILNTLDLAPSEVSSVETSLVKMLSVSEMALSPTLAYDAVGSYLIEKATKGGAGHATSSPDVFFNRFLKNCETYAQSDSPYEAYGITFLSPLFEGERIGDIKDLDRRRTGPAMKKGVVNCRKCKSKYTTSRPKQDRSADEPMSFLHDCRMCGEHWKTSG